MENKEKLESFRKQRIKLVKVSNGSSVTHRIGKGSMAKGVKKPILPNDRHEAFLKMHNL